MVALKTILSALALPLLSSSLVLRRSGGDFTTQTWFRFDLFCRGEPQDTIVQAGKDAVQLAEAVFDDCRELKTNGEAHKCIDWETQAFADYFGPETKNSNLRERIYDTLYRATQTKPQSDDQFNSRYVEVFCTDLFDRCRPDSPAYTWHNGQWPAIVYCPAFFLNLSNHQDLKDAVQKDTSGQSRLNVRNLRSRATTVLHEWLHIRDPRSFLCEGGCDDTIQYIGPLLDEEVMTYKAGRSKLLANRDVEKAARTNDNYVYFAMSMFMQKTFGVYPTYPKMWDYRKSRKDNEDNEKNEPGAPSLASLDLEDSAQGNSSTRNLPYPKEAYPQWYWPVLDSLDNHDNPQLNIPQWEPPLLQVTPDTTAGQCRTTESSPNTDDCYAALSSLYDSMTMTPPLAGGEGWYWPGIYNTCVIQIHYTGNWKNCNATIADVYAHGQLVLNACADSGNGTVSGWLPFTPENCPGTIDIMAKNGDPPEPPTQPPPPSNQCPAGCDCSSGTPLCT